MEPPRSTRVISFQFVCSHCVISPARLNFEVLYDPEGLQGGKDPLKDRYKEFEDSNNENQAPDSLIEIAYSSNVGVEPLSERSVDTYNQPEDVPPNDENNPSN